MRSIKKFFLKISQYSQENTCVPLGLQPYQKETLTQVFPVNIPKFLRTSVLGPWVKVNVILH